MKKIHFLFIALITCVFLFTNCKKEEYIVTFHPNGGAGTVVTQYFIQKTAQPLMANSFVREGYVFTGWNTEPSGSGVSYKELEAVIFASNMILYAQWQTITTGDFTVTFNANGGVGEMSPQEFKAGTSQALSANAFVNEGFYFTGWCTSMDGTGKKYDNQQVIAITAGMTLFAQWAVVSNTYFVFFNANGGEGTMEPQAFIDHEYKSLTANTFERENSVFIGWNTKADGSGYFVRDKQDFSTQRNIILYAQWINPEGGGEPCPGTPTVKDFDGNTYKTVKIGSQCWMRENLKTTKYNTGTNIPIVTDYYEWNYNTTGAMCYYDNQTSNGAKYGALYNGFAVNTNKLCPSGWHVPSNEEWNLLANHLGGANVAGYKMKTFSDWPNYWSEFGGGTNESGFSALPTGYRDYTFEELTYSTYFWSSTSSDYYQGYKTLFSGDKCLRNGGNENQAYGFSVRCIKD